jgi:exonuclease VII small subunit
MNSKKIPPDIRSKSIKEAQNEIKEIIITLENKGTKLEESIDKYNRMVHLNYHIQEEFKKKAKSLSNTNVKNNKQAHKK